MDGAQLAPPQDLPQRVANATTPRLLIVDDEACIRRAIQRCFPKLSLFFAETGLGALELALTTDFDLILCDLSLPDLSGADLYSILCEKKPALAGRVMIITGGAHSDDAQRFLIRGEVPVLTKPFGLNQLRSAVARYLPQPSGL